MSDISKQSATGGSACQGAANAATPALPSLPYLRRDAASPASADTGRGGTAAAPARPDSPARAAGAGHQADLERSVAEAVMRRLPEGLNQRQDMADIVRKAVDTAVRQYAGQSGPGGCPAPSAPSASGKASSCASCGACSGPGISAAPSSTGTSGPGRTLAGTVTAVDATKLAFGRFPGAPDSVVNIVDVITPRDGSPMGGGYLKRTGTTSSRP